MSRQSCVVAAWPADGVPKFLPARTAGAKKFRDVRSLVMAAYSHALRARQGVLHPFCMRPWHAAYSAWFECWMPPLPRISSRASSTWARRDIASIVACNAGLAAVGGLLASLARAFICPSLDWPSSKARCRPERRSSTSPPCRLDRASRSSGRSISCRKSKGSVDICDSGAASAVAAGAPGSEKLDLVRFGAGREATPPTMPVGRMLIFALVLTREINEARTSLVGFLVTSDG